MGSSFEYSKTLALEGSILLLLSVVPYVGWVLGIIGVILLLRGVKELGNYYQDSQLYQNSLTGVKYYIVALIALAVAGGGFLVAFVPTNGFTTFVRTGNILALTIGIAFLIVAFIFYVLAAMHLRKTFDALAQKSGEHSFATAASLLWVGAILTIIGIGVLLILIAWIFVVVGFFTMRTPQPTYAQQPYGYTPTVTESMTQQPARRFCPNCGSPVALDATYCSHCGKQLTT